MRPRRRVGLIPSRSDALRGDHQRRVTVTDRWLATATVGQVIVCATTYSRILQFMAATQSLIIDIDAGNHTK